MQNFFTNTITVNTDKTTILEILLDPKQLMHWDSEIQVVYPQDKSNGYQILRAGDAANKTETLTISRNQDSVDYYIHGDRLSYLVKFDLISDSDTTTIKQHVSIDTDTWLASPIMWFKPIAKRAFLENLQVLAAIAEHWSNKSN